jgi:hypothetical protein
MWPQWQTGMSAPLMAMAEMAAFGNGRNGRFRQWPKWPLSAMAEMAAFGNGRNGRFRMTAVADSADFRGGVGVNGGM